MCTLRQLSVYMPHMNPLQSTMWPGTLIYIHFILLEFASEQICHTVHLCTIALPLSSTYRPHSTLHVGYKIINSISYGPCCHHISASNKYAPQIPYICCICQVVYLQITDSYVSIYTSYDLTTVNNVSTSTGIFTLQIISICLRTNMPGTSQIYMPLH